MKPADISKTNIVQILPAGKTRYVEKPARKKEATAERVFSFLDAGRECAGKAVWRAVAEKNRETMLP